LEGNGRGGRHYFKLEFFGSIIKRDGSGKEGIKVPPKWEDLEGWQCLSHLELNVILFKTTIVKKL
jgi:hypothetical protein